MKLIINDKVTIKELQQQFNNEFPYLKLEFFDTPPTFDGLPKSLMHSNNKLLAACRKLHHDGIINITPDDTVEKLEKTLWQRFGLTAEVFRKSGNVWIETTLSHSWTLKRQNEEGMALNARNFKAPEHKAPRGRDTWQ
jgi:hypothetical protein